MLDRAFEPTAPQAAVRPQKVVVEYPGQHVPTPVGPAVERATFLPAPGVNPNFQGAARRGTLDDGSDPTPGPPLSHEAVRELRATIRPALPADALASVPHPSPELLAVVGKRIGGKNTIPKAARAQLAEIDARWMRLNGALCDLLATTPNQRYRQNLDVIATRIASGSDSGAETDGWTKIDFEEDQREKQSAFRREMRKLELAAWELCAPFYALAAQEIDRLADDLEMQEQATAASWAVPYTRPSETLLRLRKCAAVLRTANYSGVGRPATMFDFLPR